MLYQKDSHVSQNGLSEAATVSTAAIIQMLPLSNKTAVTGTRSVGSTRNSLLPVFCLTHVQTHLQNHCTEQPYRLM